MRALYPTERLNVTDDDAHFPRYATMDVARWLFIFGQLYILIGIMIVVEDKKLLLMEIDYTAEVCHPDNSSEYGTCQEFVIKNPGKVCRCHIEFQLDDNIPQPVYVYYELTRFYQNHRLYTESKDPKQLLGKHLDASTVSKKCAPFNIRYNKAVAPCGSLANSMFNDSFILRYDNGKNLIVVPLRNTNISWVTEKQRKYRNPPGFANDPKLAFGDTLQPSNWQKFIYELDPTNPSNNGFENEDFIVWMRASPFPTFRKLYRIVDHVDEFKNSLPKGSFELEVDYAFPTLSFSGRKKVLIGNMGWLGGKNPFLGYFFIVMGVIIDVVLFFLWTC